MVIIPTLFIGLGGTGKAVLYEVRRRLVSRFDDLSKMPAFVFLSLDTADDKSVGDQNFRIARGAALSPMEHLHLTISQTRYSEIREQARRNPASLPTHLRGWLTYDMMKDHDSIDRGAGAIRGLGRLALLEHRQEVEASLTAAYRQLTTVDTTQRTISWITSHLSAEGVAVDSGDGWQVFVVGSLMGGTGAGMFIDAGYLVSEKCGGKQPEGIFTIPLRDVGRGEVDCRPNACAALIELNHYSDSGREYTPPWDPQHPRTKSPYDYTYLLSTSTCPVGQSDAKTVTVPELVDMVGHYLFLRATSEFSKQLQEFRVNFNSVLGNSDARGNNQKFLTFGLSVIEVPVENIVESCACRLASEALDRLRTGGLPEGQSVAVSDDTAMKTLVRRGLSDDAVADALTGSGGGGGLRSWYATRIEAMVRGISTEILLPWAPLARVLRIAQETQRELDARLGEEGIRSLSGTIEERYPDIERACLGALGAELDQVLNSERRGVSYAQALLEALRKRFQKIEDAKKAAPTELKEKVEARVRDLAGSTAIIQEIVSDWLLLWYRRPILARYLGGRHSRLLRDLCRLRLDQVLAPYEAQLFRKLRERTEDLERKVVSLEQHLASESAAIARRGEDAAQLSATAMKSRLYTPSDVKRGVVGDVDLWWRSVMSPSERDNKLKEYDTQAIRPLIVDDDGAPNVFLLQDKYQSEDEREVLREELVGRAAKQFSHVYAGPTTEIPGDATGGPTRISSDVVERFFRRYGGAAERSEAMKAAVSGSSPYLMLSYGIDDWKYSDAANHAGGVLLKNWDAVDSSRQRMVKGLLDFLLVPEGTQHAAKGLDEAYQLIVHQHFAGFPLRAVAEMEGLHRAYQEVVESRLKPVHTEEIRWERWDKPRETIVEDCKRTFIVAQALKDIMTEVELRDGNRAFEFKVGVQKRTKALRGNLRDVVDALVDTPSASVALAEEVERRHFQLGDRKVAESLLAFDRGLHDRRDIPFAELQEYRTQIEAYASSFPGVREVLDELRSEQPEEEEEEKRYVRVLLSGRAECPRCGKEVARGEKFCPDKDCQYPLVWHKGAGDLSS